MNFKRKGEIMKLIKKENLKVNKKDLIIGAVIIIAIIAIAAAYGLSKKSDSINTGKAKAVSTEQKKETKKTNKGKKKKDIAGKDENKAKSEEKEKDDKEEETAKGENKASKSSSNTKSGSSTASTPSNSSNSSGSSSTHAQKPKRWVVDQAAWDETVTKYRTETVTKYYCGGQYFDDYNSGYAYYMSELEKGNNVGSLSPVTQEIQVPYQEVIHHDEVGHWE